MPSISDWANFAMLAYQAYRGNPTAALEVLKIVATKSGLRAVLVPKKK